jgi:uncharacterized membrane protein YedE/YeeE
MENFTPIASAAGGMLIGLAAALLWLSLGRIAGISGIVGGILPIRRKETAWRAAFLAGLLAAPLLLGLAAGYSTSAPVFESVDLLVVAGLLVGFGTRLGSGCTSGHGVCGIARLSPRSLISTGVFMATAAAAVFLVRHVIGA